jgi:hypothetical protein
MSYARMSEKEKILAQEVSALLAEAEAIDKAEDARFGKTGRGDELPAELRRREDRLVKIREAKAALEAQVAEAAAEWSRARSRERGEDADTTEGNAQDAAAKAVPKPKAQRDFTDPESKIMKTSDGSFHQRYNGQAVVDEAHQVIVAADVNDCAADVANLIPMTEQATANTGQAPEQVLADAGYRWADNLDAANEFTDRHGSEFFIATGRAKHDDPPPVAPRGPIPKTATGKQRMARTLKTKTGRAAYARRKVIVEPVFGQMGRNSSCSAASTARGEWLMLSACHNLRKLHGHIGIDGLAALASA